jgi:hypothetical protein
MSENFIIETQQIKKSIELINSIDHEKFQLLLTRVASKIHSNFESFKQEEIEKLKTSLALNEESIFQIIDILEFILLQAAYHIIKPHSLLNQLLKIKVNNDKSDLIVEIWKINGKDIIDKIRNSKTISFNKFKNINWRLNLQMATNLKSKQKIPNAMFSFEIQNSSAKNDDKSILVEFDREGLYDLLNNLEIIQKQIDALNE